MTLSEIGEQFGTDKGTIHSYLPLYEKLLSPIRDKPINLLEIGVDHGNSMAMWLEWLPNAMVHGFDISLPQLNPHPRLRLFQGDQSNENHLHKFRNFRFDVIIDDGSHRSADQLLTFHALWPCLNPGGWYFVEDVVNDRIHYWDVIPFAQIHEFRKDWRIDDVLISIPKKK